METYYGNSKGKMVLGQRPIKKLQTKNKMGESLALGGLTGGRRAQSDGAVPVRVKGSDRVVIDGLWAKGQYGIGSVTN
jgi:hypothetical protein